MIILTSVSNNLPAYSISITSKSRTICAHRLPVLSATPLIASITPGRIDGRLIAFRTISPRRAASTCPAMATDTAVCASIVDAPICGVTITKSDSSSRLPDGGSHANTSSAAPETRPSLIARMRASSLMMPPRAQLMIRTPFFMIANWGSLIRLRVPLVSGVCIVM